MSGTPGFNCKPAQKFGFENAVAFVAATPQSPGAAVYVSCSVAGNIVLVTRGGQTVTLNVPIGLWEIPLSCSQMTSNTGTMTAFNVW